MTDHVLVDTNLLLAVSDTARASHQACKTVLERYDNLVAPAQVFREYLVVATRPPARNGLGLGTNVALANLRGLRTLIALLPEEKPLLHRTLELVAKVGATGARIHDITIVAAALCHGVTSIVTSNTEDFTAFADVLTVRSPEQLS